MPCLHQKHMSQARWISSKEKWVRTAMLAPSHVLPLKNPSHAPERTPNTMVTLANHGSDAASIMDRVDMRVDTTVT